MPNASDLQPLLTWLTTMERAHVNLGRWGEAGSGQGEDRAPSLTILLSLLQTAEGPVLGSPAPSFLSHHELLPVPTLAGGGSCSTDPRGTKCALPRSLLWPGWDLGSAWALEAALCWVLLLCPALGWHIHSSAPKLFVCLQTLLNECIAPHVDELGNVSASAPAPGSYLCRMFR